MKTLKIASFEFACELLQKLTGLDYSVLPGTDGMVEHLKIPIQSQYKLWVIAEAYRQGKRLTYGYYPWWYRDRTGSGSEFASDVCACDYVSSGVGARLELPDSDVVKYVAKQHKSLYRDVMVITDAELKQVYGSKE